MFQDATEKDSTLLSFAQPMSSHADAPRLRPAWPNGRVEHFDSFQSEAEINDWISRKCFGWLGALPSVSPNLDRAPATVANLAPSCLATRLRTTFGVSRRCCFSNVTSGQNAGARVIRVRRSELGHYPRAPTEAALTEVVLCLLCHHNGLGLEHD
jgi:hypothetical protein